MAYLVLCSSIGNINVDGLNKWRLNNLLNPFIKLSYLFYCSMHDTWNPPAFVPYRSCSDPSHVDQLCTLLTTPHCGIQYALMTLDLYIPCKRTNKIFDVIFIPVGLPFQVIGHERKCDRCACESLEFVADPATPMLSLERSDPISYF